MQRPIQLVLVLHPLGGNQSGGDRSDERGCRSDFQQSLSTHRGLPGPPSGWQVPFSCAAAAGLQTDTPCKSKIRDVPGVEAERLVSGRTWSALLPTGATIG